jgi:hypothetical protein
MSTKDFAIANVKTGKLNALVKNIMRLTGQNDANEAIRLINSKLWTVVRSTTCPWRVENGIIYLTVTSDGTTGAQWVTRLESRGYKIDTRARQILLSESFKPTSGITTEIAIISGIEVPKQTFLFMMRDVLAEANKRGWLRPNLETACMLRELFSYTEIEALKLTSIDIMSEFVEVDCLKNSYLHIGKSISGDEYLYSGADIGMEHPRGCGYAFALSIK